jgi:hypothetical protein
MDVSYCKYGMPYRKQTRLWTNLDLNLKVCKKDCEFMNGAKHIGSAGNGRKKYTDKSYKLTEKYVIPEKLCLEIIEKIEDVLGEEKKNNNYSKLIRDIVLFMMAFMLGVFGGILYMITIIKK